MSKKISLREQRRIAREAQLRKQRMIVAIAVGAGVLFIALLAFLSWNRQRLENVAATATTAAQMVTNTVIAATQAVQATTAAAAQATTAALSASIQPMTFAGVPTDTVKTSTGLQYKDVEVGSGPEAQTGDTATVHYTGWLTDGTEFDSSVGSQPFPVENLGQASVIQGWNEGLVGMKAGGRRILVIPPDLGYGEEGSPPTIPANATLVFEVVLLEIR
jgi:FKBP-type peptidyl-prolyl cis-trans isomerase FkpA